MSSNKHTYPIDDVFLVDNLETLKVLTHPQRIEIIHTLRHPKTVKQIAEEIEADPTKLYYHIRQMEKVGAIKVVETNIVSGIVEKKYLVAAQEFKVESHLLNGQDITQSEETMVGLLDSLFNSTSRLFKRSIQAGMIKSAEQEESYLNALLSTQFRLTTDQSKEFGSKLETLVKEFTEQSKENWEAADGVFTDFVFTLALFPQPPDDEAEQ